MLIIVNIIFFLAGAAILGVGLWVKFDPAITDFANSVEKTGSGIKEFRDTLNIGAYILIAFGAFTFVVGFCGCCGAMRESKVRQLLFKSGRISTLLTDHLVFLTMSHLVKVTALSKSTPPKNEIHVCALCSDMRTAA